MRRFVKTFFVKRRAQVTVLQDSVAREFVVYLWRAGAEGLEVARAFPYDDATARETSFEAVEAARALVVLEAAEEPLDRPLATRRPS